MNTAGQAGLRLAEPLAVRGTTMRRISGQLFISPSTVHTHVAHIYEKTGVSTRAGAAVFAMENDLLRPQD